MKRQLYLVISLVLAASACNGPGAGDGLQPAAACSELAVAMCAKAFECYSAEERAAIGIAASEAGCVAALEAELECAVQTVDTPCDEGKSYRSDQAAQCVSEYHALSCEAFRDGAEDGDIPSCARSCQ